MAESVLWAAEPPDEERDEADDVEVHGDVDDSFAARRLRRWLRGMFGGEPERAPERDADDEGSG